MQEYLPPSSSTTSSPVLLVTRPTRNSSTRPGAVGGPRCHGGSDRNPVVFGSGSQVALDPIVLGGGPRTLDAPGHNCVSLFPGLMGGFLLSVEEGREALVSTRHNLRTIHTALAEDHSTREGDVWVACT